METEHSFELFASAMESAFYRPRRTSRGAGSFFIGEAGNTDQRERLLFLGREPTECSEKIKHLELGFLFRKLGQVFRMDAVDIPDFFCLATLALEVVAQDSHEPISHARAGRELVEPDNPAQKCLLDEILRLIKITSERSGEAHEGMLMRDHLVAQRLVSGTHLNFARQRLVASEEQTFYVLFDELCSLVEPSLGVADRDDDEGAPVAQ